MVCSRLCGRAPKAVIGLGRFLRSGAKDGMVTKLQLEQAMRIFHISLTVEVCVFLSVSGEELA